MAEEHESENGELDMDRKELVKEHEKLVKVLKSPSHKDDLTEAQKQLRELKAYKRAGSKGETKEKD